MPLSQWRDRWDISLISRCQLYPWQRYTPIWCTTSPLGIPTAIKLWVYKSGQAVMFVSRTDSICFLCLAVVIEPFYIIVWSVQASPGRIQQRVLLFRQGQIPSHACPVSVIRMAVHNHTYRYFPPVAREQILSYVLSTSSEKLLTEFSHCLHRSEVYLWGVYCADMSSSSFFLSVCLQIRWSDICSGWLWVLLSPWCVCI